MLGAFESRRRSCKTAIGLDRERTREDRSFAGGGAGYGYPLLAYGTSKAAIVRMCETMAMELDAHGIAIDVNIVAPGANETDMLAAVRAAGGEVRTTVPFSKPVALCRWLVSPESDGISGRFLHVNDDYRGLLPGHYRRRIYVTAGGSMRILVAGYGLIGKQRVAALQRLVAVDEIVVTDPRLRDGEHLGHKAHILGAKDSRREAIRCLHRCYAPRRCSDLVPQIVRRAIYVAEKPLGRSGAEAAALARRHPRLRAPVRRLQLPVSQERATLREHRPVR